MAETTKVKLTNNSEKDESKKEKEFDLKHAERILQIQEKHKLKDWAIASKQPFEFKNGVINPTGKKENSNTAE